MITMGILVAIIGVCIPIVAIVSNHHYKLQKAKLDAEAQGGGATAQYVRSLENKMERLALENKELKDRMGNVETIIADPDFLLGLPSKSEDKIVQEKIAQMAAKAKE